MTNPAVHVVVTTEVGYCPFCRRSRTLRREERHLGGLVRVNVDCESCHRTLSSTLGPPPPKVEEAPTPAPAPEPEGEATPEPKSAPRPAAKKADAAKKPATTRSRGSTKKTRA